MFLLPENKCLKKNVTENRKKKNEGNIIYPLFVIQRIVAKINTVKFAAFVSSIVLFLISWLINLQPRTGDINFKLAAFVNPWVENQGYIFWPLPLPPPTTTTTTPMGENFCQQFWNRKEFKGNSGGKGKKRKKEENKSKKEGGKSKTLILFPCLI